MTADLVASAHRDMQPRTRCRWTANEKGSPGSASLFGKQVENVCLADAGRSGVLLRLIAVRIMMSRFVGNIGFRLFELGWLSRGLWWPGHFTLKFILSFGEFTDRLSHALGKFRELLRAEKEQDDEQDNDQVRPGEVEKTGDVHMRVGFYSVTP